MNNQAPSFAERLAFQANRVTGSATKPCKRQAAHYVHKTWRGGSNVSKEFR